MLTRGNDHTNFVLNLPWLAIRYSYFNLQCSYIDQIKTYIVLIKKHGCKYLYLKWKHVELSFIHTCRFQHSCFYPRLQNGIIKSKFIPVKSCNIQNPNFKTYCNTLTLYSIEFLLTPNVNNINQTLPANNLKAV